MGLGVEWIFPTLLGQFLPMRLDLRLPWHSALAGLGTGILTTVLFCLPPLLQIRSVRPNLVLRRMVEEPGAQQSWWTRLRDSKAQWIIAIVILLGLGAIAAALSDSVVVGRWFAGALCALLVVILGSVGAHLAFAACISVAHPDASAIRRSPWLGESVSAGESIRGCAGGSGHGRDAHPDRLSHAARCDWGNETDRGP